MDILISGLNNYVGRRSVSLMGDDKFTIFAITRNLRLFEKRVFEPLRAKIFEADLMKGETVSKSDVPDVKAAFYFTQVPTLNDIVNLKLELLCLRNFVKILQDRNCNRLVYVARLMDKDCVDPILALLQEYRMDYTIVLKNTVVGRDSLIDRVFKNIANRKFIIYSKEYASRCFQPLGVHDFICWLKSLLDVPAFHYKVLEVGGAERISFMAMFEQYKDLKLIQRGQRFINVPRFFAKFMYQHRLDISSTDYAELSRVIQSDNRADNAWLADMPFEFSPINVVLQKDA